MIARAAISRIDRPALQGRTGPILAAIETENGEEVEVFVKLSAGCDQGVVNLAREAIAACLAADLGLPVPRPWLVEIPTQIISVVPNAEVAEKLRRSASVAFGSTRAPEFVIWPLGSRLTDAMRPVAADILLFDAIIQNPDRRTENPNCLVRGDELRIIDHELAFAHRLIIGWQPPWTVGSMRDLETFARHIFMQELKGSRPEMEGIRARWIALSDDRLEEYGRSVPPEWAAAHAEIEGALKLIANSRDKIDACIAELWRVLT